jgi:hypothetical protein
MPNKTISYLKKRCDDFVGEKVRSIGRCGFCGSFRTLQWCHYITRRDIRFRYHEKNNACLCMSCHSKDETDHAWFEMKWNLLKGVGTTEWLEQETRKSPSPIHADFYREIIKRVA